jgi:hypothetical protein
MTTTFEITRALADLMPREGHDRPALKKGARCSITAGNIIANGTVAYGYGADITRFVVRLDGTGQLVDVPIIMIGMEAMN